MCASKVSFLSKLRLRNLTSSVKIKFCLSMEYALLTKISKAESHFHLPTNRFCSNKFTADVQLTACNESDNVLKTSSTYSERRTVVEALNINGYFQNKKRDLQILPLGTQISSEFTSNIHEPTRTLN
jgi:hypothetical protein